MQQQNCEIHDIGQHDFAVPKIPMSLRKTFGMHDFSSCSECTVNYLYAPDTIQRQTFHGHTLTNIYKNRSSLLYISGILMKDSSCCLHFQTRKLQNSWLQTIDLVYREPSYNKKYVTVWCTISEHGSITYHYTYSQ
jgi:hypothetical protein